MRVQPLVLLVLLPQVAAAEPDAPGFGRATALVARGDQLFARAHDDKTTWKAIGYYREALKARPGDHAALWRTARAYLWLTEVVADRAQHKDLARKGYDYALQASRRDPKRVEGHYYAARCVGEYGDKLGIFAALRQGIAGKYRRHLDAALRIDPAFDFGGPHRLYAMYHHTVPWPMKDRDRAYWHFRRALHHGAGYPLNHYCLATVLIKDGRHDEARVHLERCTAADPERGDAKLNVRLQRSCRRMLEQLKR